MKKISTSRGKAAGTVAAATPRAGGQKSPWTSGSRPRVGKKSMPMAAAASAPRPKDKEERGGRTTAGKSPKTPSKTATNGKTRAGRTPGTAATAPPTPSSRGAETTTPRTVKRSIADSSGGSSRKSGEDSAGTNKRRKTSTPKKSTEKQQQQQAPVVAVTHRVVAQMKAAMDGMVQSHEGALHQEHSRIIATAVGKVQAKMTELDKVVSQQEAQRIFVDNPRRECTEALAKAQASLRAADAFQQSIFEVLQKNAQKRARIKDACLKRHAANQANLVARCTGTSTGSGKR